ncbi:MAG: transporter substrate-binding protein [Actinomycetia bacterium]|nr:transporter substrate-binding protein [Actinomycetes bacterium]
MEGPVHAHPFVIGLLYEFADVSVDNALDQFTEPLQLRFDEAAASGELDRPVELVVRQGVGLPEGTAKAVERAWLELAEAGALAIVGPGNTDSVLAVKPLAEAHGIPTINFSGSERTRGAFNFHFQLGSLPEEGPLLARAIGSRGVRRLAVIRDRSPIGDEYFSYFDEARSDEGVAIVFDQKVSPVEEDLQSVVAAARSSGADGLLYLGIGLVLGRITRATKALGWHPPAFANSAGSRWYWGSDEDRALAEGWVYVDMCDELNEPAQAMLDRYEQRYGRRPTSPIPFGMYDIATLIVRALRLATVHTPRGVMEGLERIHQLPATCGGAGTVQGFGPWERTALKGPDLLVLRQMRGGASRRYAGHPPSYEAHAERAGALAEPG